MEQDCFNSNPEKVILHSQCPYCGAYFRSDITRFNKTQFTEGCNGTPAVTIKCWACKETSSYTLTDSRVNFTYEN